MQEEPTMEDTAQTLQIYVSLDGQEAYNQDIMVDIEGNKLNTFISILIDPDAWRSYVSPKMVDVYKLGKVKHDKPWLVQLAIGMKRKVSEIVKYCEANLNDFPTRVNLNILP